MKEHWRPSASIQALKKRASVLAQLRQFFAAKDVLEVETPLLCQHGVTDPYMELMTSTPFHNKAPYYLQTSPEYAMKRLLAAGSGPIYQLCKAFRRGETSRRHNPEFSLLEWYRPGFDHHQLMAEVSDLLTEVLALPTAKKITYGQLFEQHFGINPHEVSCEKIEAIARQHLDIQMQSTERDDWLNLLMAEVIEPTLGFEAPVFIVDYPASQAALAKFGRNEQGTEVAHRFELYINGLELANGYLELTDYSELKQRLIREQQKRERLDLPHMKSDKYLLAAAKAGLPACAGVALGFDRLMMLAAKAKQINDVISFDVERA